MNINFIYKHIFLLNSIFLHLTKKKLRDSGILAKSFMYIYLLTYFDNMNANIMKTQILYKIEYEIRGQ